MAVTEEFRIEWFSIIILILSLLLIVFFIITAIYYFNMMNLNFPSKSESTFLFWISLIIAMIVLAVGIIAIVRIVTHKTIIRGEPLSIRKEAIVSKTISDSPNGITITETTTVPNITTDNLSRVVTNVKEVPLSIGQTNTLNNELISLTSALAQ